MSHFSEITSLPASFDGLVRLFPLPNLVMFPQVVQPLHIFEPRYCDMLEEAMATDQLLTLALLQPGWEQQYVGRPPLEPVACVGRIVSHTLLPEGRHNVLLLGLKRVSITYELPASAAFRRARVELLDDEPGTLSAAQRDQKRERLMNVFRQAALNIELQQQIDQLLAQDLELGMLCDVVAFTSSLDTAMKQRLLAETNVDRRANLLIRAMEKSVSRPNVPSSSARGEFPPKFSLN